MLEEEEEGEEKEDDRVWGWRRLQQSRQSAAYTHTMTNSSPDELECDKKAPRRLALPKRTEATRNLPTPPNWTARNCSRYTGVGETDLDTNTQKEGAKKTQKTKEDPSLCYDLTSFDITGEAGGWADSSPS